MTDDRKFKSIRSGFDMSYIIPEHGSKAKTCLCYAQRRRSRSASACEACAPARVLEFEIWILPFDLAQGGELVENPEFVEVVEPFVICHLVLGIY